MFVSSGGLFHLSVVETKESSTPGRSGVVSLCRSIGAGHVSGYPPLCSTTDRIHGQVGDSLIICSPHSKQNRSSILATQEALISIQQQYFHLHQTSERQIAALKAETETLQHDLDERCVEESSKILNNSRYRIQQVGALEQQVVDGTLQFEQQAHKLRIQLDNQTRRSLSLFTTAIRASRVGE